MNSIDQIYSTLEVSPQQALIIADQALNDELHKTQFDDINWAKAYVLVELQRFEEAKLIWLDNYQRTNSHRALHQIGMVERESGNLERAVGIYLQEKQILDHRDSVAVGANLYELTYCHFLKGQAVEAFRYFSEYEKLHSEDLNERGCFYRLKGDLYASLNVEIAKNAYTRSKDFFEQASSPYAVQEVQARIDKLLARM